MHYVLLNQTFYPDVMATGQYLAEVAQALVEQGHEVTVITSRRAYDDSEKKFKTYEQWRGVRIHRVACTGFGKGSKWRRALDFASFILSCCLRLISVRRADAVLALTTPPLISFVGAVYAQARGCRFYYWVMDFNPDEAIAAGWLRAGSLAARVLERMSRYSLQHATRVVALDRFMSARVLAKGIAPEKVAVIPPWSHDEEVRFDATARKQFRATHGLENKFVVMYSGNHSPVHPLGTLLEAAERLAEDSDVVFCFVGGGSEWRKIRDRKTGRAAIISLPYQPLDGLAGSLSAADLHVVVMGDAMLGLVHPCKIYNILSVGAPVMYIGPNPSHVTDILEPEKHRSDEGSPMWGWAPHGDAGAVVEAIRRLRQEAGGTESERLRPVSTACSKGRVLPKMLAVLTG